MPRPRKKQRPRRTNPPPPATPALPDPEPTWAVRRWGLIRIVVALLAAGTALGFWGFGADEFVAERSSFWMLIGIGIGAAGLVSALRMIAFPVEAIALSEKGGWLRPLEIVLARTLGDAGWLVLVALAEMIIRTAVLVTGSGWTAGLIQSLVIAPLAAFIVFASFLIVGWLLVLACCGLVRLVGRRRAGTRIPASAWWALGLVAAVALAVPATFAVGLSDTTSVSLDGGDAIATFLFGDVPLAHPWQYTALWIARLGTLAAAVSLVGLLIARMRERRRA